jgi:hypothetical protein
MFGILKREGGTVGCVGKLGFECKESLRRDVMSSKPDVVEGTQRDAFPHFAGKKKP